LDAEAPENYQNSTFESQPALMGPRLNRTQRKPPPQPLDSKTIQGTSQHVKRHKTNHREKNIMVPALHLQSKKTSWIPPPNLLGVVNDFDLQ